jgi:DNA-binding response OmpR family regulator
MTTSPVNKVMLVEDDAAMQSVLRTLLEIEGFEVVVPPNYKSQDDILAVVLSQQPDVILLDVHLGIISGMEILRQIRSKDLASSTRIVMTSGMDLKDECMLHGADSFLMKPYMPDELLRKLRG